MKWLTLKQKLKVLWPRTKHVIPCSEWKFEGKLRYREVIIIRSHKYCPFKRIKSKGVQLTDEKAEPLCGTIESVLALSNQFVPGLIKHFGWTGLFWIRATQLIKDGYRIKKITFRKDVTESMEGSDDPIITITLSRNNNEKIFSNTSLK